jgi:hypothetical protein
MQLKNPAAAFIIKKKQRLKSMKPHFSYKNGRFLIKIKIKAIKKPQKAK